MAQRARARWVHLASLACAAFAARAAQAIIIILRLSFMIFILIHPGCQFKLADVFSG
jgi:hypothetical protein